MLIDEIKKANIDALKAHDNITRGILTVVMTKYKLQEVENKIANKETGDKDLLSIIQKTLKELDDEKEGYLKVNNLERAKNIDIQQNVLKGYLPSQLTIEEIKAEIAKLSDKSIPSIMKHFKTNFQGKVDMSLVSQVARGL